MSLYLPAVHAETDLTALDRLADAHDFATLVTVREEMPTVSHLPLLYRRDGDRVVLRGHFARPNPQARHAGRALAVLHGPHAYISPTWYLDKDIEAHVPTWNYAVAHLSGELETFSDEAALAVLVSELSDRHEARIGSDWRFEPEREDHRVQLRGIIGFRLHVDRIELKFKLDGSHPPANRSAVANRLAQQPDDGSRGVAALMRERLTTTPKEN